MFKPTGTLTQEYTLDSRNLRNNLGELLDAKASTLDCLRQRLDSNIRPTSAGGKRPPSGRRTQNDSSAAQLAWGAGRGQGGQATVLGGVVQGVCRYGIWLEALYSCPGQT